MLRRWKREDLGRSVGGWVGGGVANVVSVQNLAVRWGDLCD